MCGLCCGHSANESGRLVEDIVQYIVGVNPVWIYVSVCAVAYLENLFPPFPSDAVIVAVGSLVGVGTIDFSLALLLATIGSTLGFLSMYKIGDWFGVRILEAGKLKFIPLDQVHKVERWFRKHGYYVVVANRFLSGTRAVVSFFAGMSELSVVNCSILSFLSALAWNFILLFAGQTLGENLKTITPYLQAYGIIVTAIVLAALVFLLLRYFYKRRTTEPGSTSNSTKDESKPHA